MLWESTKTIIAYREKNDLNGISISNSILEHQFLTKNEGQISEADTIFKLLERNIKLLEMGKGNWSLKIENSIHWKAVRKIAPWFPAAVKALRTRCNGCQWERCELLYFPCARASAHNVYKCSVPGYRSESQLCHSTNTKRRFRVWSCL